MKPLFISGVSVDVSVGGIERYLKNMMEYCRQHGQEAVFLLPATGEESVERIGKMTIIKKSFMRINYRKIFNRKEVPRAELKKKSKELFDFLKELIPQETIGIISAEEFAWLPPVYSFVLNMVSILTGTPVVLRMHLFTTTNLQISLVNDLFWEKIQCVSKGVATDCFAKGVPIDRLRTDLLGVNTREFTPELGNAWLKKKLKIYNGKKIILHASRIIHGEKDILKEKGIITLLEAFSLVRAKNHEAVLVLAIATPEDSLKREFYYTLNKLKGYIKLHGLEDRVHMSKFKLEEMPLVYNGADLFVLASENEPFGQVYLEAMACGVPVIGTNAGGVPEIITDGQNGFLIEPGNSSLLAQSIETLLEDDITRNAFIENGLGTVQGKFSADRQFRTLFNYLKSLAAAR